MTLLFALAFALSVLGGLIGYLLLRRRQPLRMVIALFISLVAGFTLLATMLLRSAPTWDNVGWALLQTFFITLVFLGGLLLLRPIWHDRGIRW